LLSAATRAKKETTGQVKVYPMDGGKPHELDVLSPIESTYRNDNLLHYPRAYQRLQETVLDFANHPYLCKGLIL
jgi:hypothetical protein